MMPPTNPIPPWEPELPQPVPGDRRVPHIRFCSPFAAAMMDRHPDWFADPGSLDPPAAPELAQEIEQHGLDTGLRRFRNRHMVRIIWRDLNRLTGLDQTFADLTALAEICLSAAVEHNGRLLQEKYGVPVDDDGNVQGLAVIGMGKFGGGELNLSSDIDIIFCYRHHGECRGGGRRALSNEQFFTRLCRAVISSLSDITEAGFCFRVDTRLRPFGDSGPLCTSLAALEQYYQREGRDWERYALIKARPVAGDLALGEELMQQVRPFVYRRYIDFTAIEALQEMHASVMEDARRLDRTHDIKRGPGGIREIEFLAQCFQLLRGGREYGLQTPSLAGALTGIESLGLLDAAVVAEIRADYVYLRHMENRIQALHDRQTHVLPEEPDLERLTRAMGREESAAMLQELAAVRSNVANRFNSIFPSQPAHAGEPRWIEAWRHLQSDRQSDSAEPQGAPDRPLAVFLRSLDRLPLSQRAQRRLDRFMPVLLHRLDARDLDDKTLNRVYDLVLAICQRSPYLVLLVQNAPALDRLIDLFSRSEWIAASVIRFPALLDELIDPSLGRQIPETSQLRQSVRRLMQATQETESVLAGLNYLKLATTLRIAVAHLENAIDWAAAQAGLAHLAAALLQGVLELASLEIEARHGRMPPAGTRSDGLHNSLAVIAYGSLGAFEPGYESDLDIVFLFDGDETASDGPRSLTAERYYARLAQRLLSFLTVMTPSGRLYPVDTRLRPNGRAGSLVSSSTAFDEYQSKSAWTWELQALSRARFIAGNPDTGAEFTRTRSAVLGRSRDIEPLRSDLLDMRSRMVHERGEENSETALPKHQAGGLVDIEFIVQFGVLACAPEHPKILASTATLDLLQGLLEIGWLSAEDVGVLTSTFAALQKQRMLKTLVPGDELPPVDSSGARAIFFRLLGNPGRKE